jgi:hypothetical protein
MMCNNSFIVAWYQKAKFVEQTETSFAMLQLPKYVSASMNVQATVKELLETAFCMQSMLSICKEASWTRQELVCRQIGG